MPPPSYNPVRQYASASRIYCMWRVQQQTFAAKAMQRDVSSPLLSILVVIMPNLHDVMKLTRSSTFSFSSGSVLFSAL